MSPTTSDKIVLNQVIEKILEQKQSTALAGGGELRLQHQKKSGKKTVRERLEYLLDFESFEEIDQLATSHFLEKKYYTDGVIVGFGKISGRKVAIYAQDFSIKGGSLGNRHAQKICKVMDTAAKIGCPIIGILDSGGARIDEGIHSLAGYGEIFIRNTRYSGIIPQISIVLGPCAGGAVYSPALTDFIFATENISQLFITGPQVIKEVLHQEISKDDLGGANVHASKSGLVHFVAESEEDCFENIKMLLSYLPDNYKSFPQEISIDKQENSQEPKTSDWENLIPHNPNKSYDIKKVIEAIVDEDSFFEIQKLYAQNIVIGFARIDGSTVGIVANQSLCKAGTLDIEASCKAARFIKTCNNFNIPIISLVDVPGFLPGVEQEHNGIICHGAKLIYAYAQATVPKITIILRKAYGGAYIVMGSKHLGADFNFALPISQIAVMGEKGAVSILHRKNLKKIENQQEKLLADSQLQQQYKDEFLNPFIAAEHGYIDGIIKPEEMRNKIIKALDISSQKVEHLPKKKHGNIPL